MLTSYAANMRFCISVCALDVEFHMERGCRRQWDSDRYQGERKMGLYLCYVSLLVYYDALVYYDRLRASLVY
jgi:hypothetical protein